MRSRPHRVAVRAAVVVLCAAGAFTVTIGLASAAGPVRVTAAFDPGASLGSATAVNVTLRLDPRRLGTAQLTDMRFAYPQSLGIVSSGLGLAVCTRPPDDFAQVLITGPRLGGCSPNAVMAVGTARALVRLTNDQVIPEYATVTLLSGAFERGRLGLVVYIDGQHPFGAKLAFAGEVYGARPPYGGELAVRMPVIPGLKDLATVSLVEMRLSIGSHAIRYYERRDGRRVAYHPDGVELPARCPRHGFRFRANIGFADGSRQMATTVTRCPSTLAAPASGL
jgi:prepilin-type processing-associated H-X9-DG protein